MTTNPNTVTTQENTNSSISLEEFISSFKSSKELQKSIK